MLDLSLAKVTIVYNGTEHTALADTGRDLGDFKSDIGGFTQRNVAVPIAALNMTIFFRPDRTSDRFEVVFELGKATGATPANMGAYTATILYNNKVVVSVNVPEHFWFCRWRWQSELRPIVREVSDIPAGQLPPVKNANKTPNKPPTSTTPPTTPPPNVCGVVPDIMGLAGVTPYMPGTGERDDIGLVTGVTGKYLDTQSHADLTLMLQQAEASASIPWHIRETDGRIYDADAHPNATMYADKPYWEFIPNAPNPVTIDISHQPDLCYLPYLLTGDPFYLEEVQFAANHTPLALPPDHRLLVAQTRGYAWMLRNISHCVLLSPVTACFGLIDKSIWTARLEAHHAYFVPGYVNSTDPVRSVLRTADDYANSRDEGAHDPYGTHFAPWQDEFLGSVFGWMVDQGLSNWQGAFDWQIGSTVARTNGISGWPKEVCTPYRANVREIASDPVVESWPEAWEVTAKLHGFYIPIEGEVIPGSDTWYLQYTRGALVYANKFGNDVTNQIAWLESELTRLNVELSPKWTFQTA